jgi:ubiquinone/menaquinone biosynthesis C-methylase UbiE
MKDLAASVEKHYSERPGLEAILENLKRKGIDLERVRAQDLYPYDQSHAGGIAATALLAQRAGIRPQCSVVDVGCGTGGAARYLHAKFSCRVVGIDLTVARLRTGLDLNRLIGATNGICLLAAQADALPLPSCFADVVWTQHVTMNLPDQEGFIRECARVLKPSGRLACHEWFLSLPASAHSPLPYPLPWAPDPSLNHAVSSEEFLRILREQNFVPAAEDVTAAMVDSLGKDVRALSARGASPERVAAGENLVRAASNGLFRCLMITASRSAPR